MIHLSVNPDRINTWLINAVLCGYFALELAVIAYIIYLILGGTMPERRRIRDGDSFDIDEDERGKLDFERPRPFPEPSVDIQGEPWGWLKDGPRPRGWPGPVHSADEPGPFDGSWERPDNGS